MELRNGLRQAGKNHGIPVEYFKIAFKDIKSNFKRKSLENGVNV
jgi:hypothetical protein